MLAELPSWLQDFANKRGKKGKAKTTQDEGGAGPTPTPWSPEVEARLRSALSCIPADLEYLSWIGIGMALHDLQWVERDGNLIRADVGFELWDSWSATCEEKYPSRADLEKRWRGFARYYKGRRFTIGSIFYAAKLRGWTDETHKNDFYTDLGNARRLVRRNGENSRFIPEWQKWIIWSGNRWEIDEDGAIIRLAKETVTAMYAHALEISDQTRRDALIKHALKSQSEARLKAMVSLAESEREVVLSATLLDADPYLLGVQNGVVDLKKGEFRAGKREDLITKQAGVSYDPNAHCPEWKKFLGTVTGNNEGLQNYLQRGIGYTLTGSVQDEVMFVLYGVGNNGKSTFRETVHSLLGDYALAADAGLLTERKNPGGATEEIARLKGRRFVAVNETNENEQLHEARVKFITSQDTITARNLYGHFFDFFPTHKTFVTTNHKPVVRGTDEGIWRRIHLLPFIITIPKSSIEKHFREKRLMPEMAGILNWAIEGVAKYLKDGLNPPPIVRDATDEYRQDMDVVGQWLEERCECNLLASTPTSAAYTDYKFWAEAEIGWTLTKIRWRRNLSDRGFKARKGNQGERVIEGFRLKFDTFLPRRVTPGGRSFPAAA
jgi:putative DNA primase/helicase